MSFPILAQAVPQHAATLNQSSSHVQPDKKASHHHHHSHGHHHVKSGAKETSQLISVVGEVVQRVDFRTNHDARGEINHLIARIKNRHPESGESQRLTTIETGYRTAYQTYDTQLAEGARLATEQARIAEISRAVEAQRQAEHAAKQAEAEALRQAEAARLAELAAKQAQEEAPLRQALAVSVETARADAEARRASEAEEVAPLRQALAVSVESARADSEARRANRAEEEAPLKQALAASVESARADAQARRATNAEGNVQIILEDAVSQIEGMAVTEAELREHLEKAELRAQEAEAEVALLEKKLKTARKALKEAVATVDAGITVPGKTRSE